MRFLDLFTVATSTVLAGSVAVAVAVPATSAQAQGAASAQWKSLFDGKTMDAWRGYQSKTLASGWRVVDGTMAKHGSAGDLISREKFANFELELEWKLAAKGNAGIFYRGSEAEKKIYLTAPEYQLLDDAGAPDATSRLTSAGAAYAIYPSPAGLEKPAGEWNTTRIVVNGAHVEHWLNGKLLLEYTLWSPDWEAKVKASKFAEWPGYGREQSGHIGIQGDHDGSLAIRNVRIKVLP